MFQIKLLVYSILLLFFSCTQAKKKEEVLPFYNTPDFTPLFLEANEEKVRVNHIISSFSLKDQHGATFTDQNIEGKVHVANFIFTHCISICPTLTQHMKKVQAAFKDNDQIVMLSYSVTPWLDSVPQLNNYAKKNEIISTNWHLLTGEKSTIYTLARQSYFAEEDIGYSRDSTEFLHTEHFILVDQHKKIRGIYNGTLGLEIDQLIHDMHVLLGEKE